MPRWLAVTLSLLHHHHAEEDSWLWPTLRQRAPQAVADLDRLEAQHTNVDPLISFAADTMHPLPQRAVVLAELHEAINAHLNDEEQVVLPLCTAHITYAKRRHHLYPIRRNTLRCHPAVQKTDAGGAHAQGRMQRQDRGELGSGQRPDRVG